MEEEVEGSWEATYIYANVCVCMDGGGNQEKSREKGLGN